MFRKTEHPYSPLQEAIAKKITASYLTRGSVQTLSAYRSTSLHEAEASK
jgi:hypothetical protein